MASPDPRREFLTFASAGHEPLDPSDPAPGQVSEDLTGWDRGRLEAVFETLLRSDLDHAWDGDQMVFHAADRPKVIEVLDRFRDAPRHEIDEVLNRLSEDEEEGF